MSLAMRSEATNFVISTTNTLAAPRYVRRRLAFTMCGTPEFMAPEFVLSTGYDKGVDLWALGCIMVEMYSGRGPFDFDGDLKKTFKAVCLIGMGRKTLDLPKHLKKKGMEAAGTFARALLIAAKDR